jgi:DNA processing protein
MYTPEKLAFLRLARSKNLSSINLFNLLESFGSSLESVERINELPQNKIILSSLEEIEKEISRAEKFGAKIITFFDEDYPQILKEIPDQALILTVKGDLNLFTKNAIAVVGSRNASLNGINFAKKIASDLAQNDIITISGLARGIDSATHEASYKNGTIAVIAGSIDNIYPKENTRLYEKIFETGLIITEMPFGAPPRPENFIQRNRIISGLSLGTVVIEAGLKSGSLTTARFALEQGREVFAMPGFPLDPRSQGSNRLIKDGAKLIENIDDILEEFSFLKKVEIVKEISKIKEEEPFNNDNDIGKISQEIIKKLGFSAITIEELIAELKAGPKLINIALTQLELMDKIEINLGKINLKSND